MPNRIIRDEIERIETALKLPKCNNREPIARVLGLLKAGYYAKLRRLRMAEARERGRHTKEEVNQLGRVCSLCGCVCDWKNPPTEDHIIPISKGGSDHISNIQIACTHCNPRKGNRCGVD